MMDLTGFKYGEWTILQRSGADKSGFALWESQCKCGTKKLFRSSQITNGKAKKQCGCEKDWTGKRFGKLIVLKKISGLGNHAAKILCQCDCGKEKIVWGGSLHQGSVRSCGCLRQASEEQKCITIAFGNYERHAKRRSLPFNLSKEDFLNICLKDCFYCGTKNSNVTQRKTKYQGILRLEHNGIDRKDNSKGYDLDNCVPCCKTCNRMKGTLNIEQWTNHIETILSKLKPQRRVV